MICEEVNIMTASPTWGQMYARGAIYNSFPEYFRISAGCYSLPERIERALGRLSKNVPISRKRYYEFAERIAKIRSDAPWMTVKRFDISEVLGDYFKGKWTINYFEFPQNIIADGDFTDIDTRELKYYGWEEVEKARSMIAEDWRFRSYERPVVRVTELRTCQVCGRIGGHRSIQYRSDIQIDSTHGKTLEMANDILEGYIYSYTPRIAMNGYSRRAHLCVKNTLCWSCYNKIRPTIRALQDTSATGLFLRKNTLEIAYEKQHQNN